MHLSHLYEDLETWYEKSFPTYDQQVQAMQYPGVSLRRSGPTPSSRQAKARPRWRKASSATTPTATAGASRWWTAPPRGPTSNYGESYPAGTTIPVRGDFNTLDNPFHYTSDPTGDHYSTPPAAGLHFLMFQPTIEIFNSVRLAMDGHFPATTLPVSPHSPHAGINSVLQTTHRQNYLVPPRRHRSFPLAEFLI